jgi:hypothetical protein
LESAAERSCPLMVWPSCGMPLMTCKLKLQCFVSSKLHWGWASNGPSVPKNTIPSDPCYLSLLMSSNVDICELGNWGWIIIVELFNTYHQSLFYLHFIFISWVSPGWVRWSAVHCHNCPQLWETGEK